MVLDSEPSRAQAVKKTVRIPNAERTEATRATLLTATIEAIVRYGYAGASSTRIAELSGLTRGAQKHHFKSKADLVAVALVEVQQRYLTEEFAKLERVTDQGIGGLLRALWKTQISDLYTAAMELRMAARSDEALRAVLVPAEREIGRKQRDLIVRLLENDDYPRDRVLEAGELILNTLRGMASQRFLYADEKREKRQLRVLEEAVRALLFRTDARR